ncbi:Mu transposase domain-containing protein [Exiguobacterium aurantiacum]|uniref:Mu transposase domain-containing protein n=1 Tax=Exiguobacterium aurantiacum TaxID=33987 RepID=UPI00384F87AB
MRPLPKTRFKMTEWRTAKVQLNYHIQVECMFYSIPYDYTREDVDVRLTANLIEVYFKASHTRLKGAIGQYATNTDHMPDNHRLYLDHNPENNRACSRTVGTNMEKFVTYILENNVEKKALGFLAVIRNLNKKHSNDQM